MRCTYAIHKEIIHYIEESINSNIYPKGSLLPTKKEFCLMFQTSRMTVRKAFDEMATRGIIYRIKGKGCFVSNFDANRDYTLRGFSKIMSDKCISFKTKVLKLEAIKATQEVADKLRIPVNDPTYLLKRARYIYDAAVSIENLYLSRNKFPGFLKFNFEKLSMVDVLEQNYNITIKRVEQKISTIDLEGPDAKILFNKNKGTAMHIIRLSYDSNM